MVKFAFSKFWCYSKANFGGIRMNIREIKKNAFEMASKKSNKQDGNYRLYSPIYIAPTGNTLETLKYYGKQEKVLTVLGAGGLPLESINYGAKKVSCFDCNILQILYFDYLVNAIRYYDYKEFCRYFSTENYNYKYVLSDDCFHGIRDLLSKETAEIFGSLYDYFYSTELVMNDLFWSEYPIELERLKKYVSYYNEEDYKKLQRRLQSEKCKIECKNLKLTDVPFAFQEKYNLILLDNILQYYKQISNLNNPNLVNEFIQEQLASCLEEDGIIEVNYGFEVAAEAIQEQLKSKRPCKSDFIRSMITRKEIEDGINIALLQNYNGYSYAFIKGVESEKGYVSQNAIISYSRKKQKN